MPPNETTVANKPLDWRRELLDSMKAAIETTMPYEGLLNPIAFGFLFGAIRGYSYLLAYKEAPSAVRRSILDLGEVAIILLKLRSASPRLPAELVNELASAVAECQETSLKLLKAMKPYSRERNGELSEILRFKWALHDCEKIDFIRRSLRPQKRTLELIVTTIAILSPSALANDLENPGAPPADAISMTTNFGDLSPLRIQHPESEDLSEENLQYIESLFELLEFCVPDEDHILESTRADSVMEEASFFHTPYAGSIAPSDNASHFYDQDSPRPSKNASRSTLFQSSTDSLQRKSGSLVRLPSFRRNRGSTSTELPPITAKTTPGKTQDGPRSVAALLSLMNRKKASSSKSQNHTTENSLPTIIGKATPIRPPEDSARANTD